MSQRNSRADTILDYVNKRGFREGYPDKLHLDHKFHTMEGGLRLSHIRWSAQKSSTSQKRKLQNLIFRLMGIDSLKDATTAWQ